MSFREGRFVERHKDRKGEQEREKASGEFATTRPTFRVADFPAWRARLSKDPWKSIATTRQTLPTKSDDTDP